MTTKKPTKRRTTKKTPEEKRNWLKSVATVAAKGGVSGGMGATVGAVEEGLGTGAGNIAKGALAVVGLAGELFVDPDENPVLAEVAKAGLHSAASITGYELGKKGVAAGRKIRDEAQATRVRNELTRQMEDDDDEDDQAADEAAAAADVVPIERKTAKKKGEDKKAQG